MNFLGVLLKGAVSASPFGMLTNKLNEEQIKKKQELSKLLEESEAKRAHKNFGKDSTIFTENTKKLLKGDTGE